MSPEANSYQKCLEIICDNYRDLGRATQTEYVKCRIILRAAERDLGAKMLMIFRITPAPKIGLPSQERINSNFGFRAIVDNRDVVETDHVT